MTKQEINVALESSVEDVKTSIGATGNTDGSTTAGTIFGKLNKIIADLASHISSWTSTRAGYIDTIKANTDRLTSARATIIDNIGATSNTGGTTSAGTVMAKLNALITNTTVNNTASKTGVLSAKLVYVISLLENSTYGLSAIKTALSSSGGMKLKSVTKTYTNPNAGSLNHAVDSGLTIEQRIGLHCAIMTSRTDYQGTVTQYNDIYYISASEGGSTGTSSHIGLYSSSSGNNNKSCYLYLGEGTIYLGQGTSQATITFYYFE